MKEAMEMRMVGWVCFGWIDKCDHLEVSEDPFVGRWLRYDDPLAIGRLRKYYKAPANRFRYKEHVALCDSAGPSYLGWTPPLSSVAPPVTTYMKMNGNGATNTVSHRISFDCVASLKTLTPHITCLALHRNLLYAASLNLINVFHASHYTHIDAFNHNNPSSGFVKSIAFADSKVFTAHQDCKIRVWLITPHSKRHRLLLTLPTLNDRLRRFMLPSNYVHVRRHKRSLWIQHCDTVSGLALNQGLMYSVSWDKSFKIWDVSGNNYRCVESVKAHEDAINAVAVSRGGTVYTASADGSIRVWERDEKVNKYRLVSCVEKQKSTVNALALKGDGRVVFSGGCDGAICMWERKEGSLNDMVLVETVRGHSGAILCLVKVEGWDWIVSGSGDQTVRIWGKERGRSGYVCKAVLEGHEKPIKSLVAVSSSGGAANGVVTLFSGSLDGDIKVWKLEGVGLKF
ncbi:protein JINGUBANG-like [Senna tora]|uniref:Protein JINGUBANG-like n=1 Tax=Senna tora TaxID=362788 RepID=A0A834SLC5_9FABA|nr:protein JINGUBANG-like [Senna tora]